jgi:Fe-S cluster biogenesis protein NfuA
VGSVTVEVVLHEQLAEQVQSVLEQLKPMIAMHGGSIELVDIKDNVVYVRLLGACIGCPSSFFTLKFGVEEAVRERIPQIQEVRVVDSTSPGAS